MKEKFTVLILTLGILLLASFFRLYGVNWDQNQHLHPDERFLTMVANGISWPKDIWEYLDTSTSPLNPHNRGFGFFVYGTFPIFFTKWVAESLGKGDYGNLTLVGRQLSAFFDLGTVVLVFLIAKQINKFQITSTKNQINPKFKAPNSKLFGILNLKNWKLFGKWNLEIGIFPFLSMFFYSIMVLPIQLSHFYAVDTYLIFFITSTFYLLIKTVNLGKKNTLKTKHLILYTSLGISFGLAFASKITAIFILPIIGIGLVFVLLKSRCYFLFFVACSLFLISSYSTIRFSQPYLFANPNIFDITLNEAALENWRQLKSLANPSGGFPPAVQWIKTKPYLFPLKNTLLWGLGLPLGIISLSTLFFCTIKLVSSFLINFKKRQPSNTIYLTYSYFTNNKFLIPWLLILYILTVFFYEGAQFAKAMRYIYPIYPSLSILSALFISHIFNNKTFKNTKILCYFIVGVLVIIYPLAFISIYSHPHTRITASEWVYRNIPADSSISGEHWDDFVPLSLPTPGFRHEKYQGIEFPLYGADSKEKWQLMNEKLKQTDYIILTSNRLYGAIMTVPEKYPITYKYYQALFDGSLGFRKMAEFTSRPNLPIPFISWCITPPFARYGIIAKPECNQGGVSFVDDYADETFTVYDHPKVLIFKKVKPVDYLRLLDIY